MALSDPFYAVKAEVLENAAAAESLAARWQQLERKPRAAEERARLVQQLGDLLLGVSADLHELDGTIELVEKQRARFRIDDAELQARREFVAAMRRRVTAAYQAVEVHTGEQNELLDGLSLVVGRLKEQGQQMNQELESQKTMLNTLEDQVEGAGAAMAKLKGKMTEMAKSKDRGKFCAILGLSLLLMLLTTLALS
ncbi:hypothetical protein AB1Y20_013393 [Prymnesium parvum]|uniref:t-SNARE coiled-coil homology domain-containing protein n=1 Tax=Prymnesium parvum TaxID=97485 RepID=A0AB34IHJ6_PRYPA